MKHDIIIMSDKYFSNADTHTSLLCIAKQQCIIIVLFHEQQCRWRIIYGVVCSKYLRYINLLLSALSSRIFAYMVHYADYFDRHILFQTIINIRRNFWV